MVRSAFIVFEGVDGSGKSTQIGAVAKAITGFNKYQNVVMTREPTHRASELVKRLTFEDDPMTNAKRVTRLFVEDRRTHYHQEISQDLKNERVVLGDRYTMSTLAYQSAQGQQMHDLIRLHLDAKIGVPDITFYLALDADTANARIAKRGGGREKFEKPDFIKTLVDVHETIFMDSQEKGSILEKLLGKVVRIDARQRPEEVTSYIVEVLEPFYRGLNKN